MGCCTKNARDSFPSPDNNTNDTDFDIQGGPGGDGTYYDSHPVSSCYTLCDLEAKVQLVFSPHRNEISVTEIEAKKKKKEYCYSDDFYKDCTPDHEGNTPHWCCPDTGKPLEPGEERITLSITAEGLGDNQDEVEFYQIDECKEACLCHGPFLGIGTHHTLGCICDLPEFDRPFETFKKFLRNAISVGPGGKKMTFTVEANLTSLVKTHKPCKKRKKGKVVKSCDACWITYYGGFTEAQKAAHKREAAAEGCASPIYDLLTSYIGGGSGGGVHLPIPLVEPLITKVDAKDPPVTSEELCDCVTELLDFGPTFIKEIAGCFACYLMYWDMNDIEKAICARKAEECAVPVISAVLTKCLGLPKE